MESVRTASAPARDLVAEILARGEAAGVFRGDVDALDVHMLISAFCVFQVANKHTFGHLFDVDLAAPDPPRTVAPGAGRRRRGLARGTLTGG